MQNSLVLASKLLCIVTPGVVFRGGLNFRCIYDIWPAIFSLTGLFNISGLAFTALRPWENDGYWLHFTATFEMAVEPLFSKTPLLIQPSAWWYCCCDGLSLRIRGGRRNSLCQTGWWRWRGWGHRNAEVGLSNRAQAEHSWTLYGQSEFTFPSLIWYKKAVAACKGGCKQQGEK